MNNPEMTAEVLVMKPYSSIAELTRTLGQKMERQEEETGRISRLKRYVSPQIAERILQRDDGDLFVSHRREVTVVFLDLRGFTAFSDSSEPEEVLQLLRSYHAAMGTLIFKY